jgi:hypothetical protein
MQEAVPVLEGDAEAVVNAALGVEDPKEPWAAFRDWILKP